MLYYVLLVLCYAIKYFKIFTLQKLEILSETKVIEMLRLFKANFYVLLKFR